MNIKRAVEIMKIEKQCVERQDMPFACDRHCEDCDLVLPTEEVKQAYEMVIGYLKDARDCDRCVHYKLCSPDYGIENVYMCEKWECEFYPKELGGKTNEQERARNACRYW